MKKLLLILLVSLFGITANSQEHLKFKGFEMNGTTEEFANKLTTVGFTIIHQNEKQIYGLKGEFAGHEAAVAVYPNSQGNVYGIAVIYEMTDSTWKIIKSRYNTLKENLTLKYGDPANVVNKMEFPYEDGSGNELLGFRLEKNELGASWQIGEIGTIVLAYQPSCIVLLYNDWQNKLVDDIQAYDDL